MYTAAVITVSDGCFGGDREDLSGPVICDMLKAEGYDVGYIATVPDEQDIIEQELIKCTDEFYISLIITTGGTGFSSRDVTPEATEVVCTKMTPGIPEAMRAEGLKVTGNAMLARQQAGIRSQSLIINLPGSPKAAKENLAAVLPVLNHGLKMLHGEKHD